VRAYVDALAAEIQDAGPEPASTVDTIFFGGGTPTAIPADDEIRLLNAVQNRFDVTCDAEITTEANPGTTDIVNLALLRAAGFNRISFGVQSFDSDLLRALDRIHSPDEARIAISAARSAGFENLSLDLMFALPRQTMDQWRRSLDEALALEPDHLSMYSLIVEPGTGFYTLKNKGRLPLPDEDLAADMFAAAIETAADAGYVQYEISNFAKPGRECRHNLHYWRNEPYFGLGCGAVSYLNGIRRAKIKSPAAYVEAVNRGDCAAGSSEELTERETMAETMMVGLRLTREGVSFSRFKERFGVDLCDVYRSEVERFRTRGLLDVTEECVRLTPKGVFLGNEVMMEFV
jgi:oxygen-independent coproporphyrinogen-3 oxidase